MSAVLSIYYFVISWKNLRLQAFIFWIFILNIIYIYIFTWYVLPDFLGKYIMA